MNQTEVNRFKKLYQRHLRLLKLQGKSQKTIDAYSRAVRRISEHFDCCPDQLTPEQLERKKRKKGSGLPLTLINFEQGLTVDLIPFLDPTCCWRNVWI